MTTKMTRAGPALVIEDFGEVVVKENGVRVEVHADGRVDVYGNAPVALHQTSEVNSCPADATEHGIADAPGVDQGRAEQEQLLLVAQAVRPRLSLGTLAQLKGEPDKDDLVELAPLLATSRAYDPLDLQLTLVVAEFTAFLSSRLSTPDRKPATGVLSWEGLEVSPTRQHVDRLVFIDHIAEFASVDRRAAGDIYDIHVSLLQKGEIKLPGITAAVVQKGLSHIVTVERTPLGTPLPQDDPRSDYSDARPSVHEVVLPLSSALQVGDLMADGTVYAGVSPATGRAMYTTQKDAPLTMKWKLAMEHAAKVYAHGHRDWRLPTKAELNVLFNNRAAIGGFDESGSNPSGWYWSATEQPDPADHAWMERFSNGHRSWIRMDLDASVRLVRG